MTTGTTFGNERVRLRPVTVADVDLITQWKRDPLVVRMALGKGTRVTRESQEEDIRNATESEGQMYLVLETVSPPEPVGYVRINWMDEAHRYAWLRFALGRRRGEGLMRDGLDCFLRRMFAEGVFRFDAEAYAFNTASLKLMDRLGFVQEGRKRKAHEDEDGHHDVVALGLLAEDFR